MCGYASVYMCIYICVYIFIYIYLFICLFIYCIYTMYLYVYIILYIIYTYMHGCTVLSLHYAYLLVKMKVSVLYNARARVCVSVRKKKEGMYVNMHGYR